MQIWKFHRDQIYVRMLTYHVFELFEEINIPFVIVNLSSYKRI